MDWCAPGLWTATWTLSLPPELFSAGSAWQCILRMPRVLDILSPAMCTHITNLGHILCHPYHKMQTSCLLPALADPQVDPCPEEPVSVQSFGWGSQHRVRIPTQQNWHQWPLLKMWDRGCQQCQPHICSAAG